MNANKSIHKYVWYFLAKGKKDQKTACVFNFQTTINLAKQLINFLKVYSLLQINLYGWGRCTPFLKGDLIYMQILMVYD